MRATYVVLTRIIAVGVVLQASFIALAWFTVINDADDGKVFAGEDDVNIGHVLHSIGGTLIPLLTLILLIVAFFAKIPGGVKWAAFVFAAGLGQMILGILAYSVPAIGALHGINAFVLLVVAGYAGRRATTTAAAAPAPGATAAV